MIFDKNDFIQEIFGAPLKGRTRLYVTENSRETRGIPYKKHLSHMHNMKVIETSVFFFSLATM